MSQMVTPHATTTADLRIAAIDVGSNSLHMVIAQVDADGAVTTLWRVKEMVGLGRASFPSHRLSTEAMDRAVAMLGRFKSMALRRGCEKLVAVATSAVREAENGGDFIERAMAEAGVNVRVVSATEEARLIYTGVRHFMDLSGGPHLIIDIGGGSVELIVGDNTNALLLESRKLGAARMTARFVRSDPPTQNAVREMLRCFRSELAEPIRKVQKLRPVRVIGTSGTLESLAEMCRESKVDAGRTILRRASLEKLTRQLLKSTARDRVAIRGLDEKRQDQIIAGALLAQYLVRELRTSRIEMCDAALREGILLEYVGRHLPELAIRRKVPDPRRRSVLDLARKCDWNEPHSLHVARLALKLFDELEPLHKLDRQVRELLEYAAMLHDIGWHISEQSHHKHSMYLIQNGGLKGFSPGEIELIANFARYHRRAMPKATHPAYMALSRSQRHIVDVGAAILRIVDGLDRSHCAAVQDLECDIESKRVEVSLHGKGELELELWAARRKTDLFRKAFGRDITFEEA